MGKTSKRRAEAAEGNFDENFGRIFQTKRPVAGRRYYRQVKGQGIVEVEAPPSLSSDLRVDSNFISPVDGTIIRNKQDLANHNARNNVVQTQTGQYQDWDAKQKERDNYYDSKEQKAERVTHIRRALGDEV